MEEYTPNLSLNQCITIFILATRARARFQFNKKLLFVCKLLFISLTLIDSHLNGIVCFFPSSQLLHCSLLYFPEKEKEREREYVRVSFLLKHSFDFHGKTENDADNKNNELLLLLCISRNFKS